MNENELKGILAELRLILESTLEILGPEGQKPVFKKLGEELCQAPST